MMKLRIIVGGYIGLYPTGGATWDYIQYVLGLRMLGHDVYYFEDTAVYPAYQKDGDKWDDCTEVVTYIRNAMENTGLDDRWAYKDVASRKWFGMPEADVNEIFATADIFINVSSATYVTEKYFNIPVRVLVDTDPMFTQVEFDEMIKSGSDPHRVSNFMSHNYFFTFGLNIHKPGCLIPDLGLHWHTTRKPICTERWNKGIAADRKIFTSILNWIERPSFTYNNQTWGQKNIIFRKFQSLPSFFPDVKFELIVNTSNNEPAIAEVSELENWNWTIRDPDNVIPDMNKYNDFIQNSYGEFSITKETYIKSASGWFSGRSACYLAAGKPVITQDTSWSDYIPSGNGLFAANNLDEAKNAVSEISREYNKHSRAAREIALNYFDSNIVLTDILEKVLSGNNQ